MKQFYEVCRLLLAEQHRKPQPQHPATQDLYTAMWQFERRNRGHRHLLDELAVRPHRYSSRHDPWKRLDTSRETLRETLKGLFCALLHVDEAHFPAGPDFLAMLQVPLTGPMLLEALDYTVRQALQDQLPSRQAYISQLHHRRCAGLWEFELKLRHSRHNLSAERSFAIKAEEPATLQQAWTQGRSALRVAHDTLRDMDRYPEFSEAAYVETLRERAHGKLDALLREFSPEDRSLLRESWPQMLRDFEKRLTCELR